MEEKKRKSKNTKEKTTLIKSVGKGKALVWEEYKCIVYIFFLRTLHYIIEWGLVQGEGETSAYFLLLKKCRMVSLHCLMWCKKYRVPFSRVPCFIRIVASRINSLCRKYTHAKLTIVLIKSHSTTFKSPLFVLYQPLKKIHAKTPTTMSHWIVFRVKNGYRECFISLTLCVC